MDGRIQTVVDSIAVGIRSDGGDVKLIGVHDGVAAVNYVIYAHACPECLMSPSQLALLLKAALQGQGLGIENVEIAVLDERQASEPLG